MSANPWDKFLAEHYPDAKPAGTAAEPAAETEAQITARVRAEEKQRAAEVTLACSIAGQPSRAPAFLAEGKTVSEVLDLLSRELNSRDPQRKGEPLAAFAARRGARQI